MWQIGYKDYPRLFFALRPPVPPLPLREGRIFAMLYSVIPISGQWGLQEKGLESMGWQGEARRARREHDYEQPRQALTGTVGARRQEGGINGAEQT